LKIIEKIKLPMTVLKQCKNHPIWQSCHFPQLDILVSKIKTIHKKFGFKIPDYILNNKDIIE